MGIIKFFQKYQAKIIEGLFVCLVGGWALSSIIREVFKEISNLDYCNKESFFVVVALLILGSAAFAVLYYMYDNAARIAMFITVYVFAVLCAYNGYDVEWTNSLYNPIGNVCFSAVLCFIASLAFFYAKNDIFKMFRRIKIKKRTANIIIAVIAVGIFAIVGATTVLRYVTYSNSTFDFGIFAQMYEYMKQKGTVDTTVERNYLLSHFGVHFSPIFYVGLPIYFIFSSPVTVQLIQALMIALPVIPITLLCRKYRLSNWMTVALSLLYVLYPATAGGSFYDIHENCFLTFLILMTAWTIERKKNILLIIFTILTFMVKEDAPIYIMVLGSYFLFSRRDKKRGIILMAASAVWFIIAVSIVNSFGLGVLDNRFSNLYFNPEGGMGQIIQTILTNPAYVISQIVGNGGTDSMDKIGYIIVMVIPVAAALFTTGKKYSRYILILPFVVINLMTTYIYIHDITFQYNFGVIALFMYLIILNISDIKPKRARAIVGTSVLCAGIMFTAMIFPKLTYYIDKYNENKSTFEQLNKAIDTIPENASVCASGYLVPHLSKNLELYDQNHLEEDIDTEYLVVDKRYQTEQDKFNNILASGQYESVYDVPGIIQIYHKK
ncbi:MAG: DUF2079 domain-containing protein [Eubacterium sp.]